MLLRWGTFWICRVPRAEWRLRPARATLFLGLAAISVLAIGYGWPYRAAHQRVAAQAAFNESPRFLLGAWTRSPNGSGALLHSNGVPCPWPLDARQQFDALRTAVVRGPTADRMVGLQILVEQWPEYIESTLTFAITRESDGALRALELHVLALYRDPATADLFASHLTDSDTDVRAAAADGLCVLHGLGFQNPAGPNLPELLRLRPAPPEFIGQLWRRWNENVERLKRLGLVTPATVAMPESTRDELERMMLNGTSWQERQAAARAIAGWPPAHY